MELNKFGAHNVDEKNKEAHMETVGRGWWKSKQKTVLVIINNTNDFFSRLDGILAAVERIGKYVCQTSLLEMCLEAFQKLNDHNNIT